MGDVGEPDLCVLGIVERSAEVVIADVICDELGTFARENTVKQEFTKIEGSGFGADVAVVHAEFAHDGDAGAIGIALLGAELAYDSGDGDAAAVVGGNVVVVDGAKGVGAFHALASAVWACAESLAEAAELCAVGGGPCRAKFWVASELAVFQVLAGVGIKDGESPVVEKGGWKTSAGGG